MVIGGFFYFTQKQYQPNKPLPVNPVNQAITTQQPQTNVGDNAVTIMNFSFNPGTLTVKQGSKVTWTNQDSAIHKIKSDTFNSGDLNQGDKFEFTFNTKGSFNYSCSIHPSMTGVIVVE